MRLSLLICLCIGWSVQAFLPNKGSSVSSIKLSPLFQTLMDTSDIKQPTPELNAVEVTTLCMNALQNQKSHDSLEICFNFSSDRCRAAIGGTLENFIQYANNPVFGSLVNCDNYEIVSIGPIIPGGPQRGEMQTVLIELRKGLTVNDALKVAAKSRRKRPTLEERLRQRELKETGQVVEDQDEYTYVDDGTRRFLRTLQKERRPPRQNCWLVHEVLFTKNAFEQTE